MIGIDCQRRNRPLEFRHSFLRHVRLVDRQPAQRVSEANCSRPASLSAVSASRSHFRPTNGLSFLIPASVTLVFERSSTLRLRSSATRSSPASEIAVSRKLSDSIASSGRRFSRPLSSMARVAKHQRGQAVQAGEILQLAAGDLAVAQVQALKIGKMAQLRQEVIVDALVAEDARAAEVDARNVLVVRRTQVAWLLNHQNFPLPQLLDGRLRSAALSVGSASRVSRCLARPAAACPPARSLALGVAEIDYGDKHDEQRDRGGQDGSASRRPSWASSRTAPAGWASWGSARRLWSLGDLPAGAACGAA